MPSTPGFPEEQLRALGSHLEVAGRTLRVLVVGLIALKLFATADHSAKSVHCQDLIALAPSDAELHEARDWVLTQDCGEAWASIVEEVMDHVEARRQS